MTAAKPHATRFATYMDTVAQFLLPALVKLTMETPKDDSEGQYVDDDNYSVESYSSVSVGGTSDAGSVASVGSQQSIGLIAGRESKNVCAWRTVLLVFVLVAGVLLTTSTYIFLSQEERGAYQDSVRRLLDERAGYVRW